MNETVEATESTALVSVEKINALEVFTDKGMTPVLEEIRNKVALLEPDITTAKGRSEIKSMANKIARSKTLLDEVGKTLVAEWKAKAKIVDDSRKKMRDELDTLKEVTRAPLTEWERVEEERKAKIENGLNDLIAFQTIPHGASVQHIQDIIQEIESITVDESWGEYKERATAAQSFAYKNAMSRLEERKAYDQQQEEIQQLRKQEAERNAIEAERRKQMAMADSARAEAEAKMRHDVEQLERRAKQAEERAKLAEENAKRQVELKLKQEADAKAEAKQRAEAQAKYEAQKKAEQEAERAKKAERQKHVNIRLAEATDALAEYIGKDNAQIAIANVFQNNVPHVRFEA